MVIIHVRLMISLQSQKAVAAHFSSKQILPLALRDSTVTQKEEGYCLDLMSSSIQFKLVSLLPNL